MNGKMGRVVPGSISVTFAGSTHELIAHNAEISARANEILASVKLVHAQADALLAAAENAVAAPCYKDAKALACEVALDEVRFALQALARGLAAINVTPAFEALLAAEKAEKFADEDEP